MKYAEYHIENHIVEVYNTIGGVESVHVNGEEISKGYSFFGRDHFFKIGADNYMVHPALSCKNITVMTIFLYKNGLPLTIENRFASRIKNRKSRAKLILGLVLGLVGGLIFGFTVTKLVQWLSTAV